MNFIANTRIVQQACTHFVQSHPCHYNFTNEISPFLKRYPHLSIVIEEISTQHKIANQNHINTIKLNMVLNSNNSQNCIIYLHGLASYCMEGKFLVPLLADSLNLCLFDSRGHGKNKSKYVTYGLLQSQELAEVVKYLVARGFKNIILWGRSMGAVACLKLLQILNLNKLIKNIKYVVADAPFVSYKQIATEIVSKSIHLPEFISGLLAQAFAQKIKTSYGLDLKQIDLSQLQTSVPINFLYSSNDQLMGEKHVEGIIKNNRGDYQTNDIKVMHNDERPAWIITKMITLIRDKLKNRQPPSFLQSKRKGLSITKYCEQALSFPETPKILTSRAIRDNIKKPNIMKVSKRQVHSQLYGVYKQNKDCLRHSYNGYNELGLSKMNIISNQKVSQKKVVQKRERKITVSQFFLQDN